MELAKIEKLIEKYLEAETTLAEEKKLKNYFSQNEVPVHLQEYKSLFHYFTDDLHTVSKKEIKVVKNTTSFKWLSVAAVVLFFMGSTFIYQKNISEEKEAQLAYMQTQKALNLISYNLNKGNNAIAQLQVFENTQNKIFNPK